MGSNYETNYKEHLKQTNFFKCYLCIKACSNLNTQENQVSFSRKIFCECSQILPHKMTVKQTISVCENADYAVLFLCSEIHQIVMTGS